jgi:hypothetical protein
MRVFMLFTTDDLLAEVAGGILRSGAARAAKGRVKAWQNLIEYA